VPPERALHFENAYRWLNDPEVTATLASNFGVTRIMESDYFDRIERSRASELVWAVLDEAGGHVGFTSLSGLGTPERCAVGGLFLGERDCWGRGYATETVRVRNRFAFEEAGVHRVEGHTINPAMSRVYEKCGYVREGAWRRKLWRGGCWRDAVLFAILDEEYFSPGPVRTPESKGASPPR
jgi:RimJ/RimL family protein N-acetyltransferase